MTFNERLRELRKHSTLKQLEIAEHLGVAVRTFQNYELGKREPNIETLIKIADLFNVSLDYLVGRNFPKDEAAADED